MARKKRTKTPTIQQLYNQERRKVERRIKAIQSRGFFFTQSPLKPAPQKPTRKSIEALKKFTPSYLYTKAKYETPTGTVSGTAGRTYERRIAARKAVETRRERSRIERIKREYRDVADLLTERYNIPSEKAFDYAMNIPLDVSNIDEHIKSAKLADIDRYYEIERQKILDHRDKVIEDIQQQAIPAWEKDALYKDIIESVESDIENLNEEVDEAKKEIEKAPIQEVIKYEIPETKDREYTAQRPPISDTEDEYEYAPNISDTILRNVENLISSWTPDTRWSKNGKIIATENMDMLSNILDRAIAREGREEVAQRMEDNAEEINNLVETVAYHSYKNYATGELSRFADILNGSILDATEKADISDMEEAEQGEDFYDE